MLRREIVMVGSELEAKISDSRAEGAPRAIDPHHVTNARKLLTASEELRALSHQTRGGHLIETLSLVETPISVVNEAAGRKRALHARYLGWAMGTKRYPNGLIGPAAERVVDAALASAAGSGAGFRILPKEGRGVAEVYGRPVPTGPLDAAAFHTTLDDRGVPAGTVLVPIEVKNVRSWVYPSASELYQLLQKSVLLQEAEPEIGVVPVLVCRRGHKTLFRMAKHLGFYVIDTRRQYLLPTNEAPPETVSEVREVLGYLDIVQWEEDPYVARHFVSSLPAVAARSAEAWRRTCDAGLGDLFAYLRRPTLSSRERGAGMDELRARSSALPGKYATGW